MSFLGDNSSNPTTLPLDPSITFATLTSLRTTFVALRHPDRFLGITRAVSGNVLRGASFTIADNASSKRKQCKHER